MRYKLQLFLVILLKIHFSLGNSNTEDYALLAQRRMQNDLNIAEIQVNFVKDRYGDKLDIILDRQQRVLEEILQTNQHLTLMQAVDSSYRRCIQRYRPGMYTKEQAQEKFTVCLNVADRKFQKLVLDVETPLNFAKNTANVQLPMAVHNCQEFASNGTLQGECVVAKVEEHTETFDEDLNNVQDKLEVNLGVSSIVARKMMECSFVAEKEILTKIGSVLQLIDLCLVDMQLPAISAMMYS